MPLYEYYCADCHGIFEHVRQMREASLPATCPECRREAPRIMSTFSAFTMREGYPRRIPDKGTYWHMGKEVKKKAKRMKGWTHPELAEPAVKARPAKAEVVAKVEAARTKRADALYRDKWGINEHGHRSVKAKKVKPERKIV
jgi:putative FmdB family regulatory protein